MQSLYWHEFAFSSALAFNLSENSFALSVSNLFAYNTASLLSHCFWYTARSSDIFDKSDMSLGHLYASIEAIASSKHAFASSYPCLSLIVHPVDLSYTSLLNAIPLPWRNPVESSVNAYLFDVFVYHLVLAVSPKILGQLPPVSAVQPSYIAISAPIPLCPS